MMRKIKVLVVEDSAFFRQLLVRSIQTDPTMDVVASAEDPYEARAAILKYQPDVMTLDVELPRMSGIEFLRQLMPQYPIPVVMVSSLNAKVFDALNAGAVDFVNKPSGLSPVQLEQWVKGELLTKVKIASTAKVGMHKNVSMTASAGGFRKSYGERIIAMGASTGGTEALLAVIKGYNVDIPGVLVVQHMPPGFTAMYAERLNNICKVEVKEARTGDRVVPGRVLIAPGDAHMRLLKLNGIYQVECKPGEKVSGHCPSVDVMFQSVAKTAGKDAIGIILTGMGADGSKGLLEMRNAGALTIGQDEATCVVYGMPKTAYDIGAVQYQLPLGSISGKVYSLLNGNK